MWIQIGSQRQENERNWTKLTWILMVIFQFLNFVHCPFGFIVLIPKIYNQLTIVSCWKNFSGGGLLACCARGGGARHHCCRRGNSCGCGARHQCCRRGNSCGGGGGCGCGCLWQHAFENQMKKKKKSCQLNWKYIFMLFV